MQKYPIGIQDFQTLREKDYLYVDKTQHIENLIKGESYFLSRSRRFGKSLLISTLKYFFEGKKKLFKGLHIENKVEWEERPVIHLDLSNEEWKKIGLRQFFKNEIQLNAKKYQIQIDRDSSLSRQFQELILSFEKKPVILVDEYDKPILHFLGVDSEQAHENRNIMREFYSVLKPMSGNIHFLFITGITRFSKTSLFSDMNHLHDITIHKKFATICGYTQNEVE